MSGYLDVVSWVEEAIDMGHLRSGDMLPSERLLAKVWEVSRPTISRAMVELRHRGLIESRPDKGHFVRDDSPVDIATRDEFL